MLISPSRAGRRGLAAAAASGLGVGLLGGLIGLGGAEFRLPLLIAVFGFVALQAVVLNKAMSLVVVATALPARLAAVPLADLTDRRAVVANLLVGSLAGAWAGAAWAVRMRSGALSRVLAVLLVVIAAALVASHAGPVGRLDLGPVVQAVAGVVAGFGIGVVAAVMGVAGGELLIPTVVLLYGADIKTAGSLSLAVSLPTMLVAFARYSRDQAFGVLRDNGRVVVAMAGGSVAGTILGALLTGTVPEAVLVPLLAGVLVVSACKVWTHEHGA